MGLGDVRKRKAVYRQERWSWRLVGSLERLDVGFRQVSNGFGAFRNVEGQINNAALTVVQYIRQRGLRNGAW